LIKTPSKPPDDRPAIEVRGLVKRFQDVVAVSGLDLTVARGECVGLLGPNGAGKTTTVEILEGLQEPTAGTVRLLGLEWATHAAEIRARIGMALQETRFHGRTTTEETVQLFRSFYPAGRRLTVDEALRRVDLGEHRRTAVMKLSGGQRQRLALAVALVGDPDIVLLDEPTTGLDPQSRRALWAVLRELRSRHRTLVLTTHYMDEAEALCDRIVIIDRGRIVAEGSPSELISTIGGDEVIEMTATGPLPGGLLEQIPGRVGARPHVDGAVLTVRDIKQALPALIRALSEAGLGLQHLSTRRASLDDVFVALTGRPLCEGVAAPTTPGEAPSATSPLSNDP
jgi:ABC-2 type transport system ATP-binding protein